MVELADNWWIDVNIALANERAKFCPWRRTACRWTGVPTTRRTKSKRDANSGSPTGGSGAEHRPERRKGGAGAPAGRRRRLFPPPVRRAERRLGDRGVPPSPSRRRPLYRISRLPQPLGHPIYGRTALTSDR